VSRDDKQAAVEEAERIVREAAQIFTQEELVDRINGEWG
jgi:hypothetical protein